MKTQFLVNTIEILFYQMSFIRFRIFPIQRWGLRSVRIKFVVIFETLTMEDVLLRIKENLRKNTELSYLNIKHGLFPITQGKRINEGGSK